MIHFPHTADLHLGKPCGRFSDDLRARLREARHGAIARVTAPRAHASGRLVSARPSPAPAA
jgi:hypothetical protein